MKILDCTIRDGGHLNKWDFDPQCVKATYYAAVKAGVDYFEIGYRMPRNQAAQNGLFAYCDDELLKELIIPSENCKVTIMIDAGKSDETLFCERSSGNTIVSVVRVAAYPYELEKAKEIVEKLHGKGYEVFLNLMASSELTDEHYKSLAEWNNKAILTSINFADSFGSFVPKDISSQIDKLKNAGFPNVGFHGHNNLQMAFANTLQAVADGAAYVDASVYGMGRGSGNLQMEVYLGYLEKNGHKGYNTVPLLELIGRYYTALFDKYNWGYKVQSLLGGLKNVHPYYVDAMFDLNTYTVDEIWNALDVVKEQCPISYSSEKMSDYLSRRLYVPLTSDKVKELFGKIEDQLTIIPSSDAFTSDTSHIEGIHSGKRFLVIANGMSTKQRRREIETFIKTKDCIVIGLNYLDGLFSPDYHMFVNRKRFEKYVRSISKDSTLVVPSFFGKSYVEQFYTGSVIYPNMIQANSIDESPMVKGAFNIKYLNIAVSAILLAYQMGASEICAVGMDGYVEESNKELVYFYNEDDVPEDKSISSVRYEKLSMELDRVNKFLVDRSVSFSIITPTSHKKYYKNIDWNGVL